ncbi:MAG: hypothetical protein Q4C96_00465 [Planctomycetia bacterium]|nr:hypothetical protein [Planctomycetia bacterium]
MSMHGQKTDTRGMDGRKIPGGQSVVNRHGSGRTPKTGESVRDEHEWAEDGHADDGRTENPRGQSMVNRHGSGRIPKTGEYVRDEHEWAEDGHAGDGRTENPRRTCEW